MPEPKPSKTEKVKEEIKKDVEKIPATTDQNLLAALSYIWVISIIMLVVKKDNEFIHFHAKQGVILFVGSLFSFIPILGWLIGLVSFIGMLVGFIKAWTGVRYEIPFAYKLSQKIKL